MSEIHNYILAQKDEILRVLAELVAIPSVMGEAEGDAPFGGEPKNALLKMCEICEGFGFSVTNYENAVGFAQYGKTADLGILCHLDVVPVNADGWKTEPFRLTEKDGVLYGRGVIDDKGPAVAALFAMKCVKELGFPMKKGVRLIFGTNEENGSLDLEIYKKHDSFPPMVFTPDAAFPVINIEKGMARSRFSGKYLGGALKSFHGGKIPNAVPDSAVCEICGVPDETIKSAVSSDKSGAKFDFSKNGGNVRIFCKGKPAHASTPETGVNAVTALISLLNRIIDNKTLRGLEEIFPFGETNGAACGLKCSDEHGALTAVFSIFDYDENGCSGTIDVRFPCCKNLAFVDETERAAFAKIGLDYERYMGDEPHITPENSDFIKTLLSVYEKIEGERGFCKAIGGGTYVHDIEGGVAFGAERGDTDYNMHGDNEFITVDELLKDAELFAEAIKEICC